MQAPLKNQLRRERERRGWSRDYVAEKVGSDAQAVGRWERSKTSPSPYHRQGLCELFRLNADELGLLKDDVKEASTKGASEEETVEQERPALAAIQEERPVRASFHAARAAPASCSRISNSFRASNKLPEDDGHYYV